MKTTIEVFLAVAIGSFLGALFGFQIGGILGAISAAIVGGIVGYIGFRFEEIVKAVPVVWKRATGWKIDWKLWLLCSEDAFYGFAIISTFNVLMALLIAAAMSSQFSFVLLFINIFGLCSVITFVLHMIVISNLSKEDILENIKDNQSWAIKYNVFSLVFYQMPHLLIKSIILLIMNIYFILKQTGKGIAIFGMFWWNLFKLIHSRERLLCMNDASIFALVTYFVTDGDVVKMAITVIVGGLFGILNYEIISKRVLKVVPLATKTQ